MCMVLETKRKKDRSILSPIRLTRRAFSFLRTFARSMNAEEYMRLGDMAHLHSRTSGVWITSNDIVLWANEIKKNGGKKRKNQCNT